MSIIEAIGNDLKMSIDDLIYEINNIKKEVEEIKSSMIYSDKGKIRKKRKT